MHVHSKSFSEIATLNDQIKIVRPLKHWTLTLLFDRSLNIGEKHKLRFISNLTSKRHLEKHTDDAIFTLRKYWVGIYSQVSPVTGSTALTLQSGKCSDSSKIVYPAICWILLSTLRKILDEFIPYYLPV